MLDVAHPEDLTWVVVVGGVAMAYMAWGIGANDVANAFGPAFGAKSLTIKQACVIAGVCEAAGAILMGGHVADTIRKGMMSVKLYDDEDGQGRVLIMMGMTSVLIAAATWLLVASKFGLPVSTTHSAVGGVIALAITTKGYDSVNWEKVGMIVASWFISPVMSAVMSFVLSMILHHAVLKHSDSLRRAQLSAPVMVFIVTFVIALFTVYKGGKGLGLHKTTTEVAIGASVGVGVICGIAAYPFVTWWASQATKLAQEQSLQQTGGKVPAGQDAAQPPPQPKALAKEEAHMSAPPANENEVQVDVEGGGPKPLSEVSRVFAESPTERLFTGFVVILAGFFSLAHGANDVANSVGPFGAVLAAFDGPLEKKSEIPVGVFIGAGAMIVIGLATYGVHVMRTIGSNITRMTPSKAFCVNFSSTIVVLIATRAGIPVSTTHASVGAVVGVGLAEGNGQKAVNWKVMAKVFLSWVLTLPIVGISAVGVFSLFLPIAVGTPFD